jgi:hypothetical protein
MPMATTRDDLFEEAKYGRMTPAEAEAEAARLGLAPLAAAPGAQKFDPMIEPWWTLPMTVAWIVWRNDRDVLENYDPYRLAWFDWIYREWRIGFEGPIHEGYFLEQRKPATLPRLALSIHFDILDGQSRENLFTFEEAEKSLWNALQDDQLQATGIPTDGEKREHIPDFEWRDLKAFEERERDVVRFEPLSRKGYINIALRRQSVLRFWPPQNQNLSAGYRTGAPGRPTPMHLVVAEHSRRLADGRAETSVVAESEQLAQWLCNAHPDLPALKPKSIRNKISGAHRSAMNARN